MELTFAERASHMLTGTVIGILTVFAILIFLWGFLVVMKLIFDRQPKPKKVEETKTEAVAQTSAPQNDTQLIAVLTAAVACMLEAQGAPATSFKIKSFRRTN